MKRPVVAIAAYHLPPGRVAGWKRGAIAVPETYLAAVHRAGGLPVILHPGERGQGTADEALGIADALLLVGGGDVHPGQYGQEHHQEVYGLDAKRDATELDLVRHAVDRGIPTLGICRGAQVVNVAFGGSLLQHLPDIHGIDLHGAPKGEPVVHDVKLGPGSRVAEICGGERLAAWSSHHQGIDRLGEGLTATGWTDDGLVEAVEHERGWLVAVQWHPEETAESDPAQQALFDALVTLW
ncbi:MAG: gamma-glutamyl-gamma-aminobutyrate hydrolase family protein [Actinomycetota bacterium]